MSKLLMGVQRRENCLLESPTGTGKTLALLSAALAWQRQQREHALTMESDCQTEEGGEPVTNEGPHEPEPLQSLSFEDFRYVEPKAEAPVELAYEDDSVATSKGKKPLAKDETPARFYGDDFDDDAFESPKKKRQKAPKPRAHLPHKDDSDSEVDRGCSPASSTSSPVTPEVAGAERDPSEELESPASYASGGTDLGPAASSKSAASTATPRVKPIKQEKRAQKTKKRRVPRVFFCSRTHSQLNQVVAELRTCRTAFQDTSVVGIGEDGKTFSMALLASRKSTCINKEGELPSMPYDTRIDYGTPKSPLVGFGCILPCPELELWSALLFLTGWRFCCRSCSM